MIDPEPTPSYAAPTLAAIRAAVCRYYNVREHDFLSNMRGRWIARPRQVAMYLARDLTLRSYPEIGAHFGKRDHTTIMYGVQTISHLRMRDAELARDIDTIRSVLTADEKLAA
jgi:chromosomal replication initiator protein